MRFPDDNYLGAAVPAELLLASHPVAVLIRQITAYPTGFTFVLSLRRPPAARDADPVWPLAGRHRSYETQAAGDAGLRVVVGFSDGRRGVGGMYSEEGLVVREGKSERTDAGDDVEYWVTDLPPAGPVEFALVGPSGSPPYATGSLEGGLVRDAACRSQPLWPSNDTQQSRQRAEDDRRGRVVLAEDDDYDDEGWIFTGRFSGYWEVSDGDEPQEEIQGATVEDALAWARQRAAVVLVRAGGFDYHSAGDEQPPGPRLPLWPPDGLVLVRRRMGGEQHG